MCGRICGSWPPFARLDAFTGCRVLHRKIREKIRVAYGISPARMIATHTGSIRIHATL